LFVLRSSLLLAVKEPKLNRPHILSIFIIIMSSSDIRAKKIAMLANKSFFVRKFDLGNTMLRFLHIQGVSCYIFKNPIHILPKYSEKHYVLCSQFCPKTKLCRFNARTRTADLYLKEYNIVKNDLSL
jgi:hypothetical protein